jgi:hypothetical protein
MDTVKGTETDSLSDAGRYVIECPMYDSLVRASVCEQCKFFGGYGRVDASPNPEVGLRLACTYGTMRQFRRLQGQKEPMVCCPLVSFRPIPWTGCLKCPLFAGVVHRTRSRLKRMLGLGTPFIHCRHAVKRHIQGLA